MRVTARLPGNAGLHFFHIPKRGGTTLRIALESAFEPGKVVPVKDEWAFEAQSREGTLDLKPLRCFAGHFRRDQFDILKTVTGRDWITVTCMRDPLEQFLSHFYMIKWLESHQHHEAVKDLSLEEALEIAAVRELLADFQTRWVLGAAENIYYRWLRLDREALRNEADAKLSHFFRQTCAVAGTTERLYLTYLLICAASLRKSGPRRLGCPALFRPGGGSGVAARLESLPGFLIWAAVASQDPRGGSRRKKRPAFPWILIGLKQDE